MIVIFIFGAMVIGAGAMLSPAWPTAQPRIGLAASMALALIVGGAVFWASAFGWDTLVVDYILFALVTTIFLGGSLSFGQARAEAKGEELSDEEQGWTGPEDLAFFMLVAIAFAILVLIYPAPPSDNALTLGMMALGAKLGDTFQSFAPFAPDVTYQYPPAFIALTAYLSQQLNLGIHIIQFGVSAVLAIVSVWTIYDFGSEIESKRLGRGMGVALIAGGGLFAVFFTAQFTVMMATLFTLSMMAYAYRFRHYGQLYDAVGAGLMLGAVLITHPAMLFVALGGYVSLVVAMFALGDKTPSPRNLAIMLAGVPLLALVATLPYLVNGNPLFALSTPLLDEGIANGVIDGLRTGFAIWAIPLALLGITVGWRTHREITLIALLWMLIGFGLILLGAGVYVLILPLAIPGGFAMLWAWDAVIDPRIPDFRWAPLLVGITAVVVWGIGAALFWSLPQVTISAEQVNALSWLRNETRTNTLENETLYVDPDAGLTVDSAQWSALIAETPTNVLPDTISADGEAVNPADFDFLLLPLDVDAPEGYEIAYQNEAFVVYGR